VILITLHVNLSQVVPAHLPAIIDVVNAQFENLAILSARRHPEIPRFHQRDKVSP
jgi:hypothetical protein